MRAAVYYGPGQIRLENRPEPVPTKDNMIAKVLCCAICGTDVKLATVGNPRCHPPRIIGHELVGKLTHVGEDVKSYQIGDRITLATTIPCGVCKICSLGLTNLCPNSKPISYDYDGAFAERIEIPLEGLRSGNVIRVPESISDEEACLSEPLSCAINAQELIEVRGKDSVLIVGGGPLGAIHALLAKALGASLVMIVQRSEPRLSMLRRLTECNLVSGSHESIESRIMELTGGSGVDKLVICAPSREAHENYFKLVRKGGAVSLFSSLPKDSSHITIDSRVIHYNELKVVGASDSRPEHVTRAISMVKQKKINLNVVITHMIALEKIADGIELMKQGKCLKVIVYPGGATGEAEK